MCVYTFCAEKLARGDSYQPEAISFFFTTLKSHAKGHDAVTRILTAVLLCVCVVLFFNKLFWAERGYLNFSSLVFYLNYILFYWGI